MEHILYWLWLTTKKWMNSTKITHLLEHFETIEDIYFAKGYNNIQILKESIKNSLADKNLDVARKVYERTKEIGAEILVFDDENYPDMLRNIIDPPYVLYIKGEIMKWDELFMIGVVGTRTYNEYGKLVTYRLSRELAQSGVTIVSGMARGIDSFAASSALNMNRKTIAVFGTGLDVIYPPENDKLYEKIIHNGAVISEYPPGTQIYRQNFPERNRIIAGLSRGILVTQAAKGSGSLITARCAFENNRDVFAVPGNILESEYVGTNEIIQKYAKLVMSAKDIFDEYPYDTLKIKRNKEADNITQPQFHEKVKDDTVHASIDDKKYEKLNDKEKSVISLLIKNDMHIDEIIRETKIPANEINTMMVLLEMNGLVKKIPGNNYKLNI